MSIYLHTYGSMQCFKITIINEVQMSKTDMDLVQILVINIP